MKSLVLKDLYNIGHNAKSMFLILLVFAFVFVPLSGTESYIIVCGILCSMMIVTTFTFDDNSKWAKYAMIMPVSKKDLVSSKFIVLLVFSAVGVVVGLILGSIGGVITHKITFNVESIITLLFMTLVGLVIAEIFGSMLIPLVFKFGPERGRMLLLISFLVPAAICFGIYQLLVVLGVALTTQHIFLLLCCSPLVVLIWNYMMYRISYNIFSRQEL